MALAGTWRFGTCYFDSHAFLDTFGGVTFSVPYLPLETVQRMMLLREHGHDVARGGVQRVPVDMVQVGVAGQRDHPVRRHVVPRVQEHTLPIGKDNRGIAIDKLKRDFIRQQVGHRLRVQGEIVGLLH